MAFQQQGGMGIGPGGQGEHHGPQGTEYTLQGKASPVDTVLLAEADMPHGYGNVG